MEKRLLNPGFWHSKRVLITGHTGFKGSWLSLWLQMLEADVTGFALPPDPDQSLFVQAKVANGMDSIVGDVCDPEHVQAVVAQARPQIVFHMAAQSLVRESYLRPAETFRTNVQGTINVLEAIRQVEGAFLVNVTSDKCYQNVGSSSGYREDAPLGGSDPYSNSKACAELVTASYRESFFEGSRVATARAGNVIGSCDWATDRLIPDLIRAAQNGKTAPIRYPDAVRPWQHVLDCLSGYLSLAEALLEDVGVASAWNFGPRAGEGRSVSWICDAVTRRWPGDLSWEVEAGNHPPEARLLQLDSSKADKDLGWRPRLGLEEAIDWTVEGYVSAADAGALRRVLEKQLDTYMSMDEVNE